MRNVILACALGALLYGSTASGQAVRSTYSPQFGSQPVGGTRGTVVVPYATVTAPFGYYNPYSPVAPYGMVAYNPYVGYPAYRGYRVIGRGAGRRGLVVPPTPVYVAPGLPAKKPIGPPRW